MRCEDQEEEKLAIVSPELLWITMKLLRSLLVVASVALSLSVFGLACILLVRGYRGTDEWEISHNTHTGRVRREMRWALSSAHGGIAASFLDLRRGQPKIPSYIKPWWAYHLVLRQVRYPVMEPDTSGFSAAGFGAGWWRGEDDTVSWISDEPTMSHACRLILPTPVVAVLASIFPLLYVRRVRRRRSGGRGFPPVMAATDRPK